MPLLIICLSDIVNYSVSAVWPSDVSTLFMCSRFEISCEWATEVISIDHVSVANITINVEGKEGNILFNDALNTFFNLQLYWER